MIHMLKIHCFTPSQFHSLFLLTLSLLYCFVLRHFLFSFWLTRSLIPSSFRFKTPMLPRASSPAPPKDTRRSTKWRTSGRWWVPYFTSLSRSPCGGWSSFPSRLWHSSVFSVESRASCMLGVILLFIEEFFAVSLVVSYFLWCFEGECFENVGWWLCFLTLYAIFFLSVKVYFF